MEEALAQVLGRAPKDLHHIYVNDRRRPLVGMFECVIAQFTALAVLLPVVAGQSGNTGAQSLAVAMRGLALRNIRPAQWFRVTTKEFGVALLNGIAVAATTDAVIPIILKSLNQDPAQSSSIILTTVTDVFGFLSFLGLATIFAHLLV